MTRPPPRALVLLAEGAEEMEVTILVDVLRRAGVDVTLAGLAGPMPVACSRGVQLLPDQPLAAVTGAFELIALPGGAAGAEALAASAAVGDLLRAQAAAGRLIGAICAGPIALVRHGIGAGAPMTCHPSVRTTVGAHAELRDDRVVATPTMVTSQGPGTAFEFALALVGRLCGAAVAAAVAAPLVLPAGGVAGGASAD